MKYIAEGAVYIDAGRNAGLTQGQRLVVKRGASSDAHVIAQLIVSSVAEASAVCDITNQQEPLRVGDLASIQPEEPAPSSNGAPAPGENAGLQLPTTELRNYPQLISFSEGEPLDEEQRAEVPRPPLPEVNRLRGRVGMEYSSIFEHGSPGLRSTETALVLRADWTRIAGTHWNFSGYWRGRLDNSSGSGLGSPTLNDLLSRTYHIGLTYTNPNSPWTVGVGRLLIPWASSLETIDGGYLAHRAGKRALIGMFAGSTPDPTSWSYNPNQRIGGTFVNFEGGTYDHFHYTSTFGLGISTIGWKAQKQYLFSENAFSFKRYFSLYHSFEADAPRTVFENNVPTKIGSSIGRSFLTLRFQPERHVAFDLNHTYFHDAPTFDPRLIGTGLLDMYLFQGLSGGVRVELPWWKLGLYTNLGRSSRTGDTKSSLNQLYGVTLGAIPKFGGIRADARYSKFDSAFGHGNYRAVSLSRSFSDNLRLEVQGGLQNFDSPFTSSTHGHFVNAMTDWTFGRFYWLQGGYTWQRGDSQNYDQWIFTLGRRF